MNKIQELAEKNWKLEAEVEFLKNQNEAFRMLIARIDTVLKQLGVIPTTSESVPSSPDTK